jgi:predicted metal-binding membrane protein
MLPSVAPVASLCARSVEGNRPIRLGGFAAGYLLVWAASAMPAYGLARLADRAVAATPALGTATAAVIFAANGTYMIDGIFRHQDSNGGGLITDGDTQWMTGGAELFVFLST